MRQKIAPLASTPRGRACSYSSRSTSGASCSVWGFRWCISGQVDEQPPGAAEEQVELQELKPKLVGLWSVWRMSTPWTWGPDRHGCCIIAEENIHPVPDERLEFTTVMEPLSWNRPPCLWLDAWVVLHCDKGEETTYSCTRRSLTHPKDSRNQNTEGGVSAALRKTRLLCLRINENSEKGGMLLSIKVSILCFLSLN